MPPGPLNPKGAATRHSRVMSGTVQRAAETTVTKRYEALLRVSQILISIRSSEELFRLLARELRAIVNFYVMGVGIYDEKAHEVHLKSYGEPGVLLQVPELAPEETFTWLDGVATWRKGRPTGDVSLTLVHVR